ncbi:MAG TPA: hypothetical protein VF657_19525 [Actinoplanes sp.]
MTPSDEPRPRRPLLIPVLIASVLLAVIGASAGLALGSRAGEWGTQAGGPPDEGERAPDETVRAEAACREETQEQGRVAGAVGVLRVQLRVRTATSSVWICSDDTGRLFYHANRGGDDAAWVEGRTALFLTDVEPADDGYQAQSDDGRGGRTVFRVSAQRLLILHRDGRKEQQPAVGG